MLIVTLPIVIDACLALPIISGFAGTILSLEIVSNAKSPGKLKLATIPPPPPVNKLNFCGLVVFELSLDVF